MPGNYGSGKSKATKARERRRKKVAEKKNIEKQLEKNMKLLVEKPFAFSVDDFFVPKICHNCLQIFDKGKLTPCFQCNFVRYCNADCQEEDWPEHKLQCKLLETAATEYPDSNFRLAAQMAIKGYMMSEDDCYTLAHTCNPDGSISPLENHATANDLYSSDEITKVEGENDKKKALAILRYLLEPTTDLGISLCNTIPPHERHLDPILLRHDQYSRVFQLCARSRNFAVSIPASLPNITGILGKAYYLNISKIPHSCVPNCRFVVDGKSLALVGEYPGVVWDETSPDNLTTSHLEMYNSTFTREQSCECWVCKDRDYTSKGFARELRMVSVVCKTCKSGLADLVKGIDSPIYTMGYLTEIAYPLRTEAVRLNPSVFNDMLKCSETSCGATFTFGAYLSGFEAFKKLLKRLKNLTVDTENTAELESILNEWAELRQTLIPRYNIGRVWLFLACSDSFATENFHEFSNKFRKFLCTILHDIIEFCFFYAHQGELHISPLVSVVVIKTVCNLCNRSALADQELRVDLGKLFCETQLLLKRYGSYWPYRPALSVMLEDCRNLFQSDCQSLFQVPGKNMYGKMLMLVRDEEVARHAKQFSRTTNH